jgi:hypothetical protein
MTGLGRRWWSIDVVWSDGENLKSEARNPKEIRSIKKKTLRGCHVFRFDFAPSFGFRISSFGFPEIRSPRRLKASHPNHFVG